MGFTHADADLDAMRETFCDLMSRLADRATMDPALAVLRDDFVRRRRPHIDGAVLTPRPAVEAATRLIARPSLVWRLAQDDKGLELLANGRTLRFPAEDRQALEQALSGEPFTAGELPNKRPLELARHLVNSVLVAPVA